MSRTSPIRILAIDDHEASRLCLQLTLGQAGYEVVPLGDPCLALATLETAPFSLLITDRSMPGLTGDELASKVRARHPALPILMLTGTGSQLLEDRQVPSGVTRVLGKPFKRDELLQAVVDLVVPEAPVETPPRLRILCVDDDASLLTLTQAILEKAGHEVVALTSSRAAIERIQTAAFDLVVSDFEMPEFTGDRVAAAAKTRSASLPVLMISGSLAHAQTPAGVDKLLQKPFGRKALLESVLALTAKDRDPRE